MLHFNGAISSKLPKVGTTIFTVMSNLAKQENAINLSQGFPDFSIDPKLADLVMQEMTKGRNQYAPMPGSIRLREVLSAKHTNLYGINYHPESEITITAGATQALHSAISAFVKEGDEVIIFTPAYDSYQPVIELNGGKTIFVQLKPPKYGVDWEEVKKVVSQRTKMIIINTPHNPTGAVFHKNDMLQLQKITSGTDIIVLSDEVYEHIIFDGLFHESVGLYEELRNRSLAVYSFGKSLHVTGWKTGYCVGPENLMKEFRKVHQFTVFACNHPVQEAISYYLEDASTYLQLGSFYEEKRNVFIEAVKNSRFSILPASGTYFQLLGFKEISPEKDTDFSIRLTKEIKLASIPISVFYNTSLDEKVLRFCFAKDNETLRLAGKALCSI